MKKNKGLKIIAIPIFIALGITVLSFVVMKLWNFSVVKAANLNEINYWQAMALLVLSKILLALAWEESVKAQGNGQMEEVP